ncbi:MAG: hypothetical protein HYW50_03465 [Candidatus Diapherotrites archaeon]|nr:hypothetical protein [Candidatus Diapherotrites archaeon]
MLQNEFKRHFNPKIFSAMQRGVFFHGNSNVYVYYRAIENCTHMRQRQIPLTTTPNCVDEFQIPLANWCHTLYGAGATLVAQK